jgi:hypothetical protein
MLLQALPCIRRPVRRDRKVLRGYPVAINVLLGLLLGLYPSAVKFPPFHVRVAVYERVHRLLTQGGGREFCEAHPMLMTAAFMEYCAHVLPSYMPAEFSILCSEQGMATFFDTVPVACDVFRQEMLNSIGAGCPIEWTRLEEHCAPFVDKHTRACKNRAKQRRDECGVGARIPAEVVSAFSDLPFVIPYDVHLDDSTHRMLASELAALDQAQRPDPPVAKLETSAKTRRVHETVAAMQRLLSVSPLPGNIVRMQLRSLRACMSVCERSALDGVTLYVCAACGLGGAARMAHTRGQCRLDGAAWFSQASCAPSFVCSHCQAPAVLAVNTLGRVVTLRGQRFYLAPCCGTVQLYGGSGTEFQSEYCLSGGVERCEELPCGVTLHTCPHQRGRPQPRPQRARCEVCRTTSSGAVAPEVFTVVDHLAGCMRSIRLCARHAPRGEALRQVVNWRQLMDEVNKRDRPLFSAGCKPR